MDPRPLREDAELVRAAADALEAAAGLAAGEEIRGIPPTDLDIARARLAVANIGTVLASIAQRLAPHPPREG